MALAESMRGEMATAVILDKLHKLDESPWLDIKCL
jgi:hypothetical protein